MNHLVQFSTGIGSAEVAYRVVERYGRENVVLVTADTMVEDDDNWRFAREVHEDLGRPTWVVDADGRTPMQVGRDERVVPNDRMAVCSRVLKRERLRAYLDACYDPIADIIHLGFDWTEEHRLVATRPHWAHRPTCKRTPDCGCLPWRVEAPLCEPPYLTKADVLDRMRARGIEPPRLYAQGFSHANCGGACVRGGQAQWELLLRVNRPRYLEWEAEEQTSRAMLNKDVSILADRRGGGPRRPLTLRDFRLRLEVTPGLFDPDEWGACGCTDEVVA